MVAKRSAWPAAVSETGWVAPAARRPEAGVTVTPAGGWAVQVTVPVPVMRSAPMVAVVGAPPGASTRRAGLTVPRTGTSPSRKDGGASVGTLPQRVSGVVASV